MTFIILLIIAFMIGYGIVLMKENISIVDEINRAITFNRGTNHDIVVISPDGEFKGAFGDELSPEFLMGLANSLIRTARERV